MDDDLRSIQQARDLVAAASGARQALARLDQAATDAVVEAMARAASRHAEPLARLAVEETGCGRYESKVQKNRFCAEEHFEFLRGMRTVGVLSRDDVRRVYELAEPVGIVAAIIPMTNPTSTTIYKALISLKARDPVIFSPHPRAVRCIRETAEILRDAAIGAGAPPASIQCMDRPTLEGTQALMRHPEVGVILATGGPGLVEAAYSSGKPAFGVGPGNVPAYVDRSADASSAARAIVCSQRFDNSLVCASEQSVVIDAPIREALLDAFRREGAHLCDAAETEKLERLVAPRGSLNTAIVGKDPAVIARMAGFEVPEAATVILADALGVGPEHPLSIEKLAPILALYTVRDHREGCARCKAILAYEGLGHTLALHATDEEVIWRFFEEKPAYRILVNAPASQGAVGYATHLDPSMTLGCGAAGNNITSDNITALHLINVKRLAYLREDFAMGPPGRSPATEPGTGARAGERPAREAETRARGTERTPEAPPAGRPVTPPLQLPAIDRPIGPAGGY